MSVFPSAVQQSESTIRIHTPPLFWISFPFKSPQSTEQVLISYLFYTSVQFSSFAQSCLTLCDPMDCSTPSFPVLHQLLKLALLFYTQYCIYVNSNLSIYPISLSPFGVHMFVLYVCVSISSLQVASSVLFFSELDTTEVIQQQQQHIFISRFHIQALIFDICFSLSDLLHSV